jgi:hypothetical protein
VSQLQIYRMRPVFRSPVFTSIVATLLFVSLFAGCADTQQSPSPAAEATIGALATSNAQLSTQVAELSATIGIATPTPQVAAPQPQSTASAGTVVDAAITAQLASDGPLPKLLIAIDLAPEGETLYDMRLDRATNQIFVTDSADQLHVIDATTYMPLKKLQYGGWLQLDSEHHRLYIYKPYVNEGEESLIRVIDTTTLEEVGTLEGRALAIDTERNRLFVGEPYGISTAEDAPGVRIVDGATLQQTATFTQTGEPLYNPLRKELLIVAYTVYNADPETRQVTSDLFPELTDVGDGGFLWCNGCAWVNQVDYYPAEQIVAVDISDHCTGKGCGTVEPPRFFDANTMEQVDSAMAPQVQADCGTQSSLVGAIDDRRYVNRIYDRYVVYTNLRVTDEQGSPITLRDGLRIDYANPRTDQGYLYDGTVLDLATLSPVGRWSAACLFAAEPDTGLLFGRRAGHLYVLSERGGQALPPDPALPEVLPQQWPVDQIAVSPDFANDETLLAVSGDAIYRSTDGGQRWMRLQGGLPQGQGSTWIVSFSPNYAVDRTIFAGGNRSDYWGEGVWRSQDGGNSWQAQWANLEHRRITDFFYAPEFASNQTMVVQAEFYDVESGLSGDSYQQSLDGGVTWTLVVTGNVSSAGGQTPMPPVSELLPGYPAHARQPANASNRGDSVQVTLDGTDWVTASLDLPEGDWLYDLLTAPGYPSDPTVFVFGNQSLWRSDDNGATWSSWDDPRLAGLDYTNHMSAAAISPLLGDESYRLVVGTGDGQIWVLDPAQMRWNLPDGAVPAAQAASPLATPAPGETTVPAPALPTATPGTPVTAGTGVTTTSTGSSPTPVVTATAAAEALAGEPPTGYFRPEGSTGLIWENNLRAQRDLGWARQASPSTIGGAYQRFENGTMVWRQDTSQIYVFLNDGTWRSFADTFEEGDRESDAAFAPPAGKMQPIRGFGKVWRDNPDVREKLGWALAKEAAQPAAVHTFERGVILRYGPLLFVAIGIDTDRGTWY